MIDPPAPDSAVRSDVGRVRTNNEDAVGAFEPADGALRAARGCLYVVADGMGGHAAGEVASNYAVASILRDYFSGPWEGPEAALRDAVAAANRAIHEKGSEPGDCQGMGCTVVAAALLGERAVIINVGDSRAYLLREGQLRQVSLDHSWIAERVAIGLLTREEAAAHPGKNVLTRNLGFSPETEPSVAELTLQDGDRLLLCSDGLTGPLSEDRIATLLAEGSAEQALTALIAAANEAGGPDNIGVAVIAVGAARTRPPQDRLETLPAPAWLGEEETLEATRPIPAPALPAEERTTVRGGWQLVGVMSAAPPPVVAATATATEAETEPAAEPTTTDAPEPAAPAPATWPQFAAAPFAATAPAPAAAARARRTRLLVAAGAALVLAAALGVGGVALAGRGGSNRKTVAGIAPTTTALAAAPAVLTTATGATAPATAATPAPVTATPPLLSALSTAPPSTPSATAAPTSAPASSGDGAGPDNSGATFGGVPPGPTASPTAASTAAGGASGRAIAPTPPVLFQARPGDTLQSLWQSCYTGLFPTFSVFAEAAALLNPTGVDLNDLKPGDHFVLPGGWSGPDCPLNAAPPLPGATTTRRTPS